MKAAITSHRSWAISSTKGPMANMCASFSMFSAIIWGFKPCNLKPTNILLELEHSQDAISRYLAAVPPRTSHQDGFAVPLREVIKTPLVSEMKQPRIRIVDFGVEFVQGIVLFSGIASEKGSWTADDDRLAKMIEILGPFPPEFLKTGNRTASFFDEKGNLLRLPDLRPTTLERLINGTSKPFIKPQDMTDADIPIFIDFLRGMLAIDPKRRKSAAALLQHEWLRP
ncbi:predicted protein [Uncinocarpus reesii 1704]|uniref:non-specific serine/threonine protein kinase n=1 Tax=Uncinocarpus reesii (strain UAMH 1704) TaxID=336963 RepID=C4JQA6_UNCRE|nr:uncharacterized protein UREG_04660 [Uncinocarpus reesii 1704]EEP79814.1 predicted protein [Uncinocarpus reesii 1704]